MKIIKAGEKPQEHSLHWWAGKIGKCPRCRAEFELESDDVPIHDLVERRLNGKREAWFACPTKIISVEPGGSQIIDPTKPSWICGAEVYVSIN